MEFITISSKVRKRYNNRSTKMHNNLQKILQWTIIHKKSKSSNYNNKIKILTTTNISSSNKNNKIFSLFNNSFSKIKIISNNSSSNSHQQTKFILINHLLLFNTILILIMLPSIRIIIQIVEHTITLISIIKIIKYT